MMILLCTFYLKFRALSINFSVNFLGFFHYFNTLPHNEAVELLLIISEMRILSLAAEYGPGILFCMPNRTKCVLLVSLVDASSSSVAPLPGAGAVHHHWRVWLQRLREPALPCGRLPVLRALQRRLPPLLQCAQGPQSKLRVRVHTVNHRLRVSGPSLASLK
jgi:hypothetical protein